MKGQKKEKGNEISIECILIQGNKKAAEIIKSSLEAYIRSEVEKSVKRETQ